MSIDIPKTGSEDQEGCACMPCHQRVSVIKKVLGQGGHDNFMPKWAQHIWVHIMAQDVKGPSGHPLTQQ